MGLAAALPVLKPAPEASTQPVPEASMRSPAVELVRSRRYQLRRDRSRRERAAAAAKDKQANETKPGQQGEAGPKPALPPAVAAPIPAEAPNANVAAVPDVWSDAEIVSGLKECLRLLGPVAADIDVPPAFKAGACGTPAPVLLRSLGQGGDKIEFQPPVQLNCRMVVALNKWVAGVMQPVARETLGGPITRINSASYSCRGRNNNPGDVLSQHSFANALDIASFRVADGRTIDVLKDWGPTARDRKSAPAVDEKSDKKGKSATAGTPVKVAEAEKATKTTGRNDSVAANKMQLGGEPARKGNAKVAAATKDTPPEPPKAKEAEFLHRLHSGACGVFATVLGPEANEEHRNHLHLDLQARSRRAYCH